MQMLRREDSRQKKEQLQAAVLGIVLPCLRSWVNCDISHEFIIILLSI